MSSKKNRILHGAEPSAKERISSISCLDTSYDNIINCLGKFAEIIEDNGPAEHHRGNPCMK